MSGGSCFVQKRTGDGFMALTRLRTRRWYKRSESGYVFKIKVTKGTHALNIECEIKRRVKPDSKSFAGGAGRMECLFPGNGEEYRKTEEGRGRPRVWAGHVSLDVC